MAEQLAATLEGLGPEVLAAYGGVEAWEKARYFRPVIVVLDLMVTDLDGYEVFRRIRRDPQLAGTAVIVTHPAPTREDVYRAWRLNSDCFLAKPIRTDELRLFVCRILTSLGLGSREERPRSSAA